MRKKALLLLIYALCFSAQSRAITLGTELRYYNYTEPGVVSHTGALYGVWGEWLWHSFIGDGRLKGNAIFGSITYDGALCDINGNNCTPYTANTNDIITKVSSRLELSPTKLFKLYGGVGLRYLYDKGEGTGFYQRTGTWIYIPIGFESKFSIAKHNIVIDLEYDAIVSGQMKSGLSEIDSSLSDITHKQTGYGYALDIGYVVSKKWILSAFYEAWVLNRSDVVQTNGLFFVEPENRSNSFGVKIGLDF